MTVNVVGHGYYDECYSVETATNQWDVIWSGIVPHNGCTFKNITIYTPLREFTYYTTSGNIHFYGENNRPVSATITFEGTPITTFTFKTEIGTAAARTEGATSSPSRQTLTIDPGHTYTISISATANTTNYRFYNWKLKSGSAIIADASSSSTTVTITIPSTARYFSDILIDANYVTNAEISINVDAEALMEGVVTPVRASGPAPLTQSFNVDLDAHARFIKWRFKYGQSGLDTYETNPAVVTATKSGTMLLTVDHDTPIEIVVEPDPSYGIITFEASSRTFPTFVDGVQGKGLGWWRWQGADYDAGGFNIRCTDNPNNPPGVVYIGCEYPSASYSDSYDQSARKWSLYSTRRLNTSRLMSTTVYQRLHIEARNHRYGRKLVFKYSGASAGGHILYGNEDSIIYGADGNILWGLKDPPS